MLKLPAIEQSRININLAALIDIVFLLLIYFLLTSNFIEQDSFDVKLPEVESLGVFEEGHIVITIDRNGSYFYEQKKIADLDLGKHLGIWLGQSRRKSVLVRADRLVVYDRVVRVMDLAKKHGARKLLIATEPVSD